MPICDPQGSWWKTYEWSIALPNNNTLWTSLHLHLLTSEARHVTAFMLDVHCTAPANSHKCTSYSINRKLPFSVMTLNHNENFRDTLSTTGISLHIGYSSCHPKETIICTLQSGTSSTGANHWRSDLEVWGTSWAPPVMYGRSQPPASFLYIQEKSELILGHRCISIQLQMGNCQCRDKSGTSSHQWDKWASRKNCDFSSGTTTTTSTILRDMLLKLGLSWKIWDRWSPYVIQPLTY